MNEMPKLGDRVRVWGAPQFPGRVVGYATVLLNKHLSDPCPSTLAVVELDEGFHVADGLFIPTITVHPDNLECEI